MSRIGAKMKMRGRISKRFCPCCDDLTNDKKLSTLNNKKFIDEGLSEYESDFTKYNIGGDPMIRKLFPNKQVEVYFHWFFGYDVLVVDGKCFGEYDDLNELLAYSYHCGVSFKDYEDLQQKYYDFLSSNNRWSFLP